MRRSFEHPRRGVGADTLARHSRDERLAPLTPAGGERPSAKSLRHKFGSAQGSRQFQTLGWVDFGATVAE